MTDVHGITVFGGTFPAEIWHSLYANAPSPLRRYHAADAADQLDAVLRPVHRLAAGLRRGRALAVGGGASSDRRRAAAAVGGYNPNAYAPGVGQKPAPRPRRCRQPGALSGGGGVGQRRSQRRGERLAEHLHRGSLRPDVGGLSRLSRPLGGGALARPPGRSGRRSCSALLAFALLPPLLSHDVYSYVDYARLGALARHRSLPARTRRGTPSIPPSPTSPGPTHRAPTAPSSRSLTYPLAWLPVSAAVGVLKAFAGASVLGPRRARSAPCGRARSRPAARRRLRRAQPARPRPRRRRRPQRRPGDAARDARRRGGARRSRDRRRRSARRGAAIKSSTALRRPLRAARLAAGGAAF